MVSSDEKSYTYLIGYPGDDYKIKSLCIMFPKTRTYVKDYGGRTKWMYFFD